MAVLALSTSLLSDGTVRRRPFCADLYVVLGVQVLKYDFAAVGAGGQQRPMCIPFFRAAHLSGGLA